MRARSSILTWSIRRRSASATTWSRSSASKPTRTAPSARAGRRAPLHEPYSDNAEATGLIQNSEDELYRLIEKAGRAGYQVAIHAIGDRGNRTTLNAVERARKKLPGKDLRVRIEHAQILPPADIPRFASVSRVWL